MTVDDKKIILDSINSNHNIILPTYDEILNLILDEIIINNDKKCILFTDKLKKIYRLYNESPHYKNLKIVDVNSNGVGLINGAFKVDTCIIHNASNINNKKFWEWIFKYLEDNGVFKIILLGDINNSNEYFIELYDDPNFNIIKTDNYPNERYYQKDKKIIIEGLEVDEIIYALIVERIRKVEKDNELNNTFSINDYIVDLIKSDLYENLIK